MEIAVQPLSPAFDKARTLSRVLMVFFIVGFWLNLAWMAAAATLPIWPEAARFTFDGSLIDVAGQPMAVRLNAVAAIVIRILPALFLLHHAAALFRGFARARSLPPPPSPASAPSAPGRCCGRSPPPRQGSFSTTTVMPCIFSCRCWPSRRNLHRRPCDGRGPPHRRRKCEHPVMIVVNLDVMLARRKMRSKELAERIGFTEANISLLKSGKVKGVRFETLEKICAALDCQPGDLLEYRPD